MGKSTGLNWLAMAGAVTLVGCGETPSVGSEPETPTAIVSRTFYAAAEVGISVNVDLTPVRAHLSSQLGASAHYDVRMVGDANGLRFDGGAVAGVPGRAGVVRIAVEAIDAAGKTESDTMAIAVFVPGLTSPHLPFTPFAYSNVSAPLPPHFSIIPGFPQGFTRRELDSVAVNPTTNAGATLGRVLFYDRRLSVNDSVSCGSCHLQSHGFADTARFSAGVFGQRGTRRTMALGNLRFTVGNGFFWDQRAASLEELAIGPIENPAEMGADISNVLVKIAATDYYGPLFEAAFGTREVSRARVARALAQYVRSLTSRSSAFDGAFTGGMTANLGMLTAEVREGHDLFTAHHCTSCHFSAAQIMGEASNNGLDLTPADTGAGGGRFRAPSLRNVAVRAPFMHDGRFRTLEEVVDFYDRHVLDSPDLDNRMRVDFAAGPPRRLMLTNAQRAALVAFLASLTDHDFLTTEKFSDPFARR